MNIDMVSENASPLLEPAGRETGAQLVYVRELALTLAARGHRVTVWTRRDAADLPETVELSGAVLVRHLDAGPPRPLTEQELVPHLPELAAGLRAAWQRVRPDVVNAHFWTSGMVTLAAARDVGVPTALTLHSLDAGRGRVESSVARAAGAVVATSSEQANALIRLGVPRRLVRVIPHGVDSAEFSPTGPVLPRDGRPRIVHIGQLAARRGADETVAALAAIPDAELVLAGDFGPQGRDRARLEALGDRFRVADRLRLFQPLPRDKVQELLRSADVVVRVPWHGQFGVIALEAMACARPVVASPVGGLTDTVVDGITGAHVPPRRPRTLASALRSVLGSPALTEAFGVAGRDRAVSRYGWDRIADLTEATYRETA